jgi:hypothetical protein
VSTVLERLCAECGGHGQLVRGRLVVRLVEDSEHESGYEAWFHRGHVPAGYRIVDRDPGSSSESPRVTAGITERRAPRSRREFSPGPAD